MLKKLILPILTLFSFATPAYGEVLQTTQFFQIDTGEPIQNSIATLKRNSNNVLLNLETNGLNEGAYTVWALIFNNPIACLNDCNDSDLSNPAVNASVFWIDGGTVGNDGIGKFSAQIPLKQLPPLPGQVLLGEGLVNPFDAEIHSLIRWHGPVNPSLQNEQTTTFNGGCSNKPEDGLFLCQNLQNAVFKPVPVDEPSSTLSLFVAITIFGLRISLKRKDMLSQSIPSPEKKTLTLDSLN